MFPKSAFRKFDVADLDNLRDDVTKRLDEANRTIFRTKFPAITSGDPMVRLYGAVEYQTATLIDERTPFGLLQDSYEMGRVDFASALLERCVRWEPTTGEDIERRSRFIELGARLYRASLEPLESDQRELRGLLHDIERGTYSGGDVKVIHVHE